VKAIGIDPDAAGFVCALVEPGQDKPVIRRFSVKREGLEDFLGWVRDQKPDIVAIEGQSGQSAPVEAALREAVLVFYSLRPVDTDRYRRAVLGENKNNERDAESVALFAQSLRDQGKLERFRGVWEPDADLRLISRRHATVSNGMTAETNRLWKLVRQASPDLYLALGGGTDTADSPPKTLRNEGILTLLATVPRIGEWKQLSVDQLMQAMGGGEYKGRRDFAHKLTDLSSSIRSTSSALSMVLRDSSQQLRSLRRQILDLRHMLAELAAQRPAVQKLMQRSGIGLILACGMVAEIIDIRRFPSEDHLASYSGLGRPEHSTGQRQGSTQPHKYNRTLKDFFMNAALAVVQHDPNSHLAGHHRKLIKKGMTITEATKRVARALVRIIYRDLRAVVDERQSEREKGQGEVASGRSRGDKQHLSNTSPTPQAMSTARRRRLVKNTTVRRSPPKMTKTRRVRAESA
jgi:transposase